MMRHIQQASWNHRLLAIATALVVGFSAREALAASSSLRKEDCEATNWCSGSEPELNCKICCDNPDAFCFSYDPGIQGCLC